MVEKQVDLIIFSIKFLNLSHSIHDFLKYRSCLLIIGFSFTQILLFCCIFKLQNTKQATSAWKSADYLQKFVNFLVFLPFRSCQTICSQARLEAASHHLQLPRWHCRNRSTWKSISVEDTSLHSSKYLSRSNPP